MIKQNATRYSLRRWVVLGVIMVIVLGGIVNPAVLAAPPIQADSVLSIGYLGMAGSDTANGAQLAINQINAIGGITAPDGTVYRLELLTLPAPASAETLPNSIAEFVNAGAVIMLGPDRNTLLTSGVMQTMIENGIPVLTGVTADRLTDADPSDVIFRARAPEHVYSAALATVMLEDLGITSVILVQTDVESTEALLSFEAVLQQNGMAALDKIQVPAGTELDEHIQRIVSANPDAVALWGPVEDSVALVSQLRDEGWQGRFAYRQADQAARAGILPDNLAAGVLGMDSWSYALPTDATRIFTHDYAVTFGRVPGPQAVAAYDAVWYLRGVIVRQGISADAIQSGLIGGTPQTLVQGTLHPIEYANGDLSRNVVVYELGPYGGPVVLARFDDASRLALSGGPPAAEPTPSEPTAIPTPEGPVEPTATLEGTWIEVTVNALNVRSGPGFNYDQIGQVGLGERYRVLGSVPDYSWMVIDFQGGVGWVKTEYADVLGDLGSVSIIAPPPTPTPAATSTAAPPAAPDIVVDTVVLSPAQPVPGKQFTATVTVRNAGSEAAGPFAVAATFQPGDVFMADFVQGLAGGQSAQVQLSGSLAGTGVFTEVVVADLNKEVQEANEDNNTYSVTYRVDYPLFTQQNNIQIAANTGWDLHGGINDVYWNGNQLEMRNGTTIGLIGGTFQDAHYDMLTPGLINNGGQVGGGQLSAGAVFGLILSENERAVMRVDNRQNNTLWITYKVYNDNP